MMEHADEILVGLDILMKAAKVSKGYVGIEDKEEDSEPFEEKMERLTTELSELFKQSHVLEEEIKQRLEEIGFEI